MNTIKYIIIILTILYFVPHIHANYNLNQTIQSSNTWIRTTAISKDKQFIISGGGQDNKIYIYQRNGTQYSLFQTINDATSAVYSLKISENNQFIFVGCETSPTLRIYRWNTNTYISHQNITDAETAIYTISISKDSQYLVAGSYNATFRIYTKSNNNTFALNQTIIGGSYSHLSIQISVDKQFIIVAQYTSNVVPIRVYKKVNGVFVTFQNISTGIIGILSISISEDNRYIVAGGDTDNLLQIYELNGSEYTLTQTITQNQSAIYSIKISIDNKYIAYGGYTSPYVRIYINNGTSFVPYQNLTTNNRVYTIALSEDTQYLIAGDDSGKLYIYFDADVILCPIGCLVCNGNNCSQCVVNYTLINKTCVQCLVFACFRCDSANLCSQCVVNYTLSNNTCVQCLISQCFRCNTGNNCSQCVVNYTLSNNTCVQCLISQCFRCDTGNNCSQCVANYTLSNNNCVQCLISSCFRCDIGNNCSQCVANYTLSNNTCVHCLVFACFRCDSANVCANCQLQYKLTPNNTCVLCLVDNCQYCSSYFTTCTVCYNNYTVAQIGQNQGMCILCNILGCKRCDIHNQCSECINNNYLVNSQKTQCIECKVLSCRRCDQPNLCFTCLPGDRPYLSPDKLSCKNCGQLFPSCTRCLILNYISKCFNCSEPLFPSIPQLSCQTCQNAILNCQKCKNQRGQTICVNCKRNLGQIQYYVNSKQNNCLICSMLIQNCILCENQLNLKCTRCMQNYFLADDQKLCKLCNQTLINCLQCSIIENKTRCLSCQNNLFPDSERRICKICQQIIQGCILCKSNINGITRCNTCISGYIYDPISFNCIKCSQIISNCVLCIENIAKAVICIKCNDNAILISTENRCPLCSSKIQHCSLCAYSIDNTIDCLKCEKDNQNKTLLPSEDQQSCQKCTIQNCQNCQKINGTQFCLECQIVQNENPYLLSFDKKHCQMFVSLQKKSTPAKLCPGGNFVVINEVRYLSKNTTSGNNKATFYLQNEKLTSTFINSNKIISTKQTNILNITEKIRQIITVSYSGTCVVVRMQNMKIRLYLSSLDGFMLYKQLVYTENIEVSSSKVNDACSKLIILRDNYVVTFYGNSTESKINDIQNFVKGKVLFDNGLRFMLNAVDSKIYQGYTVNQKLMFRQSGSFKQYIYNKPVIFRHLQKSNMLIILSKSTLHQVQQLSLFTIRYKFQKPFLNLIHIDKDQLKLATNSNSFYFTLYNLHYSKTYFIPDEFKFRQTILNPQIQNSIKKSLSISINQNKQFIIQKDKITILQLNGQVYSIYGISNASFGYIQKVPVAKQERNIILKQVLQSGCKCNQPCETCSSTNGDYCFSCNSGHFRIPRQGVCLQCIIHLCEQCQYAYCNNCSNNLLLSEDKKKCGPCQNIPLCAQCDNKVCGRCLYNLTLDKLLNQCVCTIKGCLLCKNSTYCATCIQGYVWSKLNQSCVCTGDYCFSCGIENCINCAGKYCLQCAQQYTISEDLKFCQYTCQKNCLSQGTIQFKLSPTSPPLIVECPPNCLACSNPIQCHLCQYGYTLGKNSQCTPCKQNCLQCVFKGRLFCTLCINKLFVFNGTCQTCSKNCFECQSPSNCTTCIAKYTPKDGSCTLCKDKLCLQCSQQNKCIKCPVGYTVNFDNTCFQCLIKCATCNYQSVHRCQTLLPGYFLDQPTQRQASCNVQCSQCVNLTYCTKCTNGYMLSQSNKCFRACSYPCYQCKQNQPTKCTACFAFYDLNQGQNTCILGNLTCNDNSSCIFCPQNYVLKNSSCIQCKSNKLCKNCDNSNIQKCIQCVKGFYISNSNCFKCPQGCLDCPNPYICYEAVDGYFIQITKIKQLEQIGTLAKCQSPCLSCRNSKTQCLQCIKGYIKKGLLCIAESSVSFAVGFAIQQTQENLNNIKKQPGRNLGQFLTFTFSRNIQRFKDTLAAKLNPGQKLAGLKVTLTDITITKNQTVLSGYIQPEKNFDPVQLKKKLNKALQGNINGIKITQASVSQKTVGKQSIQQYIEQNIKLWHKICIGIFAFLVLISIIYIIYNVCKLIFRRYYFRYIVCIYKLKKRYYGQYQQANNVQCEVQENQQVEEMKKVEERNQTLDNINLASQQFQ